MSRTEDAWKDVGGKVQALGRSFKQHYDETAEEPSSDEVKKALDTVGEGLERLFGSIGDAIRDDDVKRQAKEAVGSVVDALTATFSEAGVELRKAADRMRGDGTSAPETVTPEPAAEEAAPAELPADTESAAQELRQDLDEG